MISSTLFNEKDLDVLFQNSLKDIRSGFSEVIISYDEYVLRITRSARAFLNEDDIASLKWDKGSIEEYAVLPLVLKEPWHSYEIRRLRKESSLIFIKVNRFYHFIDIVAMMAK